MREMPDVSVIIPVYNSSRYLKECLDSIINQTLSNIEIICIDDGSTDDSLDILYEYAAKDNRVAVLEQKNSGAGVARNLGMSIARGRYLSFLDSDDFFSLTLFEDTVSKADATNADIVVYRFVKFNQKNKEYISCDYAFHSEYWKPEVFSFRNDPKKIFNCFNPTAWNKLFKREFIQSSKLFFQNNKRTNDLYFTNTALVCANRITLLDKVLVFYRVGMNTNSQATNHVAPLDFIIALKELKNFLKTQRLFIIVRDSYYELVTSTIIYNVLNNNFINSMQIMNYLELNGYNELEVDNKLIKRINKMVNYDKKTYDFFYTLIKTKNTPSVSCIRKSRMLENVKISVVIPVYNVEKYLRDCLNSVINQTIKEIEIICVDDGSTDGSSKILLEYADIDERISILKQENLGLSMARNMGVKAAVGKYIYFLDSDDMIHCDALEILYNLSEEKNLEVVYFDGETFFESKNIKDSNCSYENYYQRRHKYNKVVSGKELFVEMLTNNEYRTSVSLQFIRKDFYDGNLSGFIPGILHEDNFFAIECMLKANRVSHISKPLFIRRVRSGSIMTKVKTFAHSYGYFKTACMMLSLVGMLDLNDIEKKCVHTVFCKMLYLSRNVYRDLPSQEKKIVYYLDSIEQETFFRLVLVKKPRRLLRNINLVTNINRVVQYYKAHGFITTIKKIKEKLFLI